jgi:hypothetical protein
LSTGALHEGLGAVQDQHAAGLQSVEQGAQTHQGRIDHHQTIRCVDLGLLPNGLVVDAGKGDDRHAPPFKTVHGKTGHAFSLFRGGRGQHLGGHHGPLASASV